jgi:hypothetical protein
MKADSMVLGRIQSLLAEYDGEQKVAANKAATELGLTGSGAKDPGGKDGPTTHPVGKLDGNSGAAVLGSRGKENEKDLKDAYAAGVDNTTPGAGGSQDDKQYNIGTVQSATGEDHKTERHFKGTKEDGTTSHPADASEMGEKYSSMQFPSLVKLAFSKLNDSLALLATGNEPTAKSAAAGTIEEAKLAAAAGYELADALTGGVGQDKKAAVSAMCQGIIREALADADAVGPFMNEYRAMRAKSAAGELPEHGIDPAMAGGAVSAEGAGAGPEAGPPGGAPMDLAGMMGGAGAGGGPEPDGDEGAAAGGMMPGGEGGAGSGEHEDAINELFNALIEMGTPPEKLMAAAQAAAGGAGGVKAASHLDDSTRAIAATLVKHAADIPHIHNMMGWVVQLRNAGRAQIKEAVGARRQERDEIKGYLREQCGIR